MFSSLTATATAAAASSWAGEMENVVLLVVGFVVFFILANWVIGKIKTRRGKAGGRKKATGRKRRKR